MRRLRPLDAALLATLVPLWAVCFALYLHKVVRGELARVPVFVATPEHADGYPTVRGFRPGTGAETAGLVVGDQLIRVGEADLRGMGPIGFVARVYEAVDSELRVPVSFVRQGVRGQVLLSLIPLASPWQTVPLTLGFAATAVLVLLRVPGSRLARAFFLASLTYSFQWTLFHGSGPRVQTYVWVAVYSCSSLLMFPLMLRTMLIFPEEIAPTGAWLPIWPWLFAVFGLINTSLRFGVPPLPPTFALRASFVVTVIFIVALLVLLMRNFRRAGPLGRRQLKWVVYGVYIGTMPVLAIDVLTSFDPSLWRFHDLAVTALALIPLCVLIAIVRFNLFDIDRLIGVTAAYTVLSVLLIAGGLTVMPRLSQMASLAVGVDPASGQIAFSLLLATLVVPGQRYLRPQIERVFFPDRYALERGVDQLLRELSVCEGPQALLTLVGERLDALLQPEGCVIYGLAGATYTPVFVRGSAVPPLIEAHSPLVGALQPRAVPIDIEHWRRTVRVYLGPVDRAVLDRLRVAVVLPVSRSEPPTAFVCLGRKRSGDIYTGTDFELLEVVAKKVTGELLRLEEAEMHGQAPAI